MKNVNEIKLLCDKVKRLLQSHPHLRDSDKKLVANIWVMDATEKYNKAIESITALELLNLVSKGEVTNHDSITRARRKIQEENKDLRGTKYEQKQKEKEDTRMNINK